jgi:predicted dehydrogenase
MKQLSKDSLVRWGLLGASGIAGTWVAKAIAAQSDSKLVAVVSGSEQRVHTFVTDFGRRTRKPAASYSI